MRKYSTSSRRRTLRNPRMKIKLTVGEIKELNRYDISKKKKSGFENLMVSFWARLDHETGELDLDDLDFQNIDKYAARGHRKKLAAVFLRTLGNRLNNLSEE